MFNHPTPNFPILGYVTQFHYYSEEKYILSLGLDHSQTLKKKEEFTVFRIAYGNNLDLSN